jgi:hypothetical protein
VTTENETPAALLRAWLPANPLLAMRAVMMQVKLLPELRESGLDSGDPVRVAGYVTAFAAVMDIAVLSPPDDGSILEPGPDVSKLGDRIWHRSVDSWNELRRGPLSPRALEAWFRVSLLATHGSQ